MIKIWRIKVNMVVRIIHKISKLIADYPSFKKVLRETVYKIKPYLFYYIMLLLGLMICSAYIYARFLRTRVPREIPFELTLWRFISLVGICCVYLLVIKTILRPQKPKEIVLYLLRPFIKPLNYVKETLVLLDSSIKNNSRIKPYYTRFRDYLVSVIVEFYTIDRILIAYSFMLIPKYILLSILLVDVFWLHRIEIFYYFLFLSLLPLLYRYYRYSLTVMRDDYFSLLESLYTEVKIYDENYSYFAQFERLNPKAIYHDKFFSIRKYFEIQYHHQDQIIPNYDREDPDTYDIEYVGYAFSNKESYARYCKKYNKLDSELSRVDFEILEQDFREIEPKLLGLIGYIDMNQYTHDIAYIKFPRVILYAIYFVTWGYILVKSIHTLPGNSFVCLIPDYANPFE